MNSTFTDAATELPLVRFERVVIDDDSGRKPSRGCVMVAVCARARIAIPQGGKTYILVDIDSPGCWGIEVQNTAAPFLDDVYEEELMTLKSMLDALRELPTDEA